MEKKKLNKELFECKRLVSKVSDENQILKFKTTTTTFQSKGAKKQNNNQFSQEKKVERSNEICYDFNKRGYCRLNDKCRYLHSSKSTRKKYETDPFLGVSPGHHIPPRPRWVPRTAPLDNWRKSHRVHQSSP